MILYTNVYKEHALIDENLMLKYNLNKLHFNFKMLVLFILPIYFLVILNMPRPGIEQFFVCKGIRRNDFLVCCVLRDLSYKLHLILKTTLLSLKRNMKVCYNNCNFY